MASFPNFFLFMFLIGTLISVSESQTCKSQTFSNNRTFAHCEDLPQLSAFIHWTYDSTNDSLAVAFLAPPARSGGWVAWAVNPTDTGMIGAQAFLASVPANAPTVRTFNISGRSLGQPGLLSFEAWNLTAQFSDARFTIFASLKVPAGAKSVNQVWQAGPGLSSGAPLPHATDPANLNARSVLVFEPTSGGGGSGSPSPPAGGGGGSGSPSPPKNGAAGSTIGKLGLLFGLFVLGIICF